MTTTDIEYYINDMIMHDMDEEGLIHSVQNFEGAGVLTSNKGVVIKMEDGSEFQLSIVKSK